jgi:DNA-binding transcriptional MerR regulator
MPQKPPTLDDLVRASGYTKRQIRFYITKKLIPGAGENRGPNAVYPEETLLRLLLIAELKQRRMPPTGRRLTLAEIRHELDTAKRPGCIGEAESIREPEPDLSDHLMASPPSPIQREIDTTEAPDRVRKSVFSVTVDEPDSLRDLLVDLAAQLETLAGDSSAAPSDSDQWHRLSIPDIEINILQPGGVIARGRLDSLARSLRTLLA